MEPSASTMPETKIPQPPRCLDDDTMAAFVAGNLEALGADAEELRAHVDACPVCHALPSEVARNVFTLDDEAVDARGRMKPGSTLGRYVVGEAIGKGGMGTVYTARDPKLARKVALKVVAHAATD